MDCRFVSDPAHPLLCSICQAVAREAKQEEACGKLFCTTCIERLESSSCPNCRISKARYFTDRKSRREIQVLPVFCDYQKNGCDWKGTLEELEKHKAECDYANVHCPNICGLCLLKKDLKDQLKCSCMNRQYSCNYCGLTGRYVDITGSHDKKCEKKIVDCTNKGCSVRIERGHVDSHVIESCDYTVVHCKYASIGCNTMDLRMNMEQHENDSDFHLSMALNKIAEFSEAAPSSPYRKCCGYLNANE